MNRNPKINIEKNQSFSKKYNPGSRSFQVSTDNKKSWKDVKWSFRKYRTK